jgi:uncharacterized membrane protein YraQ (UPF0718 family)
VDWGNLLDSASFFEPFHRKNTIIKRRKKMIAQVSTIVNFVVAAFLHIWPYLLVTIPLSVAVHMSGASRTINRALQARPLIAIFLATFVGAFSPFCSCGVIPVIAALLIGGVPLAPVMSFWIASPSMDPEVFFLSVAALGWELAVWRLLTTLILSLAAGFITHFVMQRGWLGQQVLRAQQGPAVRAQAEGIRGLLGEHGWHRFREHLAMLLAPKWVAAGASRVTEAACCAPVTGVGDWQPAVSYAASASRCASGCRPADETPTCGSSCGTQPSSFWQRLLVETWKATMMVAKFMALAFFLEALITLYVPAEWITGLVGRDNSYAILMAALLGVPAYTSNLAALSMIGGLLAQGMNPAAALAFLIAGPTTTLPAMAAVWGLATRRVFVLYVSFSLVGAVVAGYVYGLVAGI